MEPVDILIIAILTGLTISTLLIVADMWEIQFKYEHGIMQKFNWLPGYCRFCLCFWISWIVVFALLILVGFDWGYFLIPMITPAIFHFIYT